MLNVKTSRMERSDLESLGGWLPKRIVMEFMGYKETQMRDFMIKYSQFLEVSRIGRRCFIKESSLISVLEMNNSKHF